MDARDGAQPISVWQESVGGEEEIAQEGKGEELPKGSETEVKKLVEGVVKDIPGRVHEDA